MILTRFKLGDDTTIKVTHKTQEDLFTKTLMFRYNRKEETLYAESITKATKEKEVLFYGPIDLETKASIIFVSIRFSSYRNSKMTPMEFAMFLNDNHILYPDYRERLLTYADNVIKMLTEDNIKEMELTLENDYNPL